MKYFPIVWSGLWRKPTRTILTMLSIVIAFLLFGVLQGVSAAFSHNIAASHLDRLYTMSKVSFTEPLPLAYFEQIKTVKGVDSASFANWFGGYYQDQKNFVFSYPVDAETFFPLYPEMVLPPEQLQALINTRNGAIIGTELAKKYGWNIGDKVPLNSQIWTHPDGSAVWDFDIVGIFDWPNDHGQASAFYFNFKYFDEARAFAKGKVGWYIVHLSDVSRATAVAGEIDRMFANSADETKTQNEKENSQSFLRQFGDINFMVTAIVGSVFFALLFLTGNTMLQSVRERIPEFAILKTLGFTDGGVLAIVLAESFSLCVFAALAGLGLSTQLFPLAKSVIGVAHLPGIVIVMGVAAAGMLALIIGAVPAWKVKTLPIVDSLRGA